MILWNPFTRSVAAAVLGLAWLSMGNASPGASVESVAASLKALEARSGGRLGLSVREAGGREILAYRGGERFALCSTFKALLAAVVLARVDAGQEQLARPIPFGEADLLDHAPVTRKHVKEGRLSVEALCQATVEISDNTAANLLLDTLGGPAGFTRQLRAWGDATTRLDRDEPELNKNAPDDPRDTTTPTAMTATLKTLLVDDALKPASRERLTAWMMASPTGAPRLRAGFPAAWKIGDKTGTGHRGATNVVGIVWPTGRPPVLVAVYTSDSPQPLSARNAVIAEAARLLTPLLSTPARTTAPGRKP